jgi:hypothetical protein
MVARFSVPIRQLLVLHASELMEMAGTNCLTGTRSL